MQSSESAPGNSAQLLNLARELGNFLSQDLGPELVQHRSSSDFWSKVKNDGTDVTSGDLLSDARLKAWLSPRIGNTTIVSEEDGFIDHPIPGRCILLDPIDGTSSYLRQNEFAIQLALLEEARVALAAIYFPESRQLIYSVKGEGAFIRDAAGPEVKVTRTPALDLSPSRIALPYDLQAKIPGATIVPFRQGWLSLMRGELDARVGSGEGYAWDLLPYLGVIEELGGTGRTIDGAELSFTTTSDKARAIWAASSTLADEIVSRLR